ncbi:hypothetical protein LCGC14_3031560 [marine sediment metagenome]|uniref:Uncharacterized protein n=1 Tax=marine sediment metagenome TaxID=412755 RepID=A0A0F8ZID7_9ZZZZ
MEIRQARQEQFRYRYLLWVSFFGQEYKFFFLTYHILAPSLFKEKKIQFLGFYLKALNKKRIHKITLDDDMIPIKFQFFSILVKFTDNYIITISIILLTSRIFIGFISKVPSPYNCPACKSNKVIEYDEYIECTSCHFEFFKEGLDEIDDENKLSIQELDGIVGAFDELKDKDTRKRLLDSLRENGLED